MTEKQGFLSLRRYTGDIVPGSGLWVRMNESVFLKTLLYSRLRKFFEIWIFEKVWVIGVFGNGVAEGGSWDNVGSESGNY